MIMTVNHSPLIDVYAIDVPKLMSRYFTDHCMSIINVVCGAGLCSLSTHLYLISPPFRLSTPLPLSLLPN